MKRKRLGYLVGAFLSLIVGFNFLGGVYAAQDGGGNNKGGNDKCGQVCEDGIKLNTCFPIIGDCIPIKKGNNGETDPTNAFPKMMGALSQIVVSLVLVVCFILVIVAGIMWAGSGEDNSQVTKAKGILQKVAITIVLLGLAGVILKAINPVFFS